MLGLKQGSRTMDFGVVGDHFDWDCELQIIMDTSYRSVGQIQQTHIWDHRRSPSDLITSTNNRVSLSEK